MEPNEENSQKKIIKMLQNGELDPKNPRDFSLAYRNLQDLADELFEKKVNKAKFFLRAFEWEDIEQAIKNSLITAIREYDCTRSDDFKSWAFGIMNNGYKKALDPIIKNNIREQETVAKLIPNIGHNPNQYFRFESLEEKIAKINEIKQAVLSRPTRNKLRQEESLDMFLHFVGYYGDFGKELENEQAFPKSIESLMAYYHIKNKTIFFEQMRSIKRSLLKSNISLIGNSGIITDHELTQKDYELLEFIIERNKIKDLKGRPFCPNSSDIIGKGRFSLTIRSRNVLSNSIRRLKDAGFIFADPKDRDQNQGYLILNPEIYKGLSFNEKLAVDFISQVLTHFSDGPVKKGTQMLLRRIRKEHNIKGESEPLVLSQDLSVTLNDQWFRPFSVIKTVNDSIFENCIKIIKEKTAITFDYIKKSGEQVKVEGMPVSMQFYAERGWCMLLKLKDSDKEHWFRLPRISNIEIVSEQEMSTT